MISLLLFAFRYLSLIVLIISLAVFSCYSSNMHFTTDTIKAVQNYTDKKTIIIDAGHGGEDCGAIGVNGVFEKDINLKIAFHLETYLTLAGYTVHLTRREDKLLYKESENIYGQRKIYDLKNRILFANDYQNSILISIHMNSYPIEKYSGLQVWYQKDSELAYQLAKSIERETMCYLQQNNHRKSKPADKNIYLLDQSHHPAILVECGFLSNRKECEKLSEENYQKELSFVIFCAILNTLETQNKD